MAPSLLEAALKRDRRIILASLLVLTALAWAYVLWLAGHMTMPPNGPAMPSMPGMDMPAALAPMIRPWTVTDFLFTLLMWTVMMIGMMSATAAPVILLYARVGRQAAARQKPFAATGWFAAGYFLAWSMFSLAAALAQTWLSNAALLTPMLKSADDVIAGDVLIVAGFYQWSSLKESCLVNCRSPLDFIMRCGGFRAQATGSLALGFRHGLYCVGCCWMLMLLLFVGGIMNIAWIAGLAILVFAEKLLKNGRRVARGAGLVLILWGLFLIGQHYL